MSAKRARLPWCGQPTSCSRGGVSDAELQAWGSAFLTPTQALRACSPALAIQVHAAAPECAKIFPKFRMGAGCYHWAADSYHCCTLMGINAADRHLGYADQVVCIPSSPPRITGYAKTNPRRQHPPLAAGLL